MNSFSKQSRLAFPFLSSRQHHAPHRPSSISYPSNEALRTLLRAQFCLNPSTRAVLTRRLRKPFSHAKLSHGTNSNAWKLNTDLWPSLNRALYTTDQHYFHRQAITRLPTLLSSAGRAQYCNCIQRSIVILRPAVRSREGRHFFCTLRYRSAIDIGVGRK